MYFRTAAVGNDLALRRRSTNASHRKHGDCIAIRERFLFDRLQYEMALVM